MSVQINYIQASKTDWHGTFADGTKYPGDEKMQIACLQRIASATEAMAVNYNRLQGDLEMYKRWYNEGREKIKKLERQIPSHKGVATKLRKKSTAIQ